MRGCQEPQVPMLTFVDMDGRVPPDHPLRTIKALADEALRELSSEFDRMYAEVGRPSIRAASKLCPMLWILNSPTWYGVNSITPISPGRITSEER